MAIYSFNHDTFGRSTNKAGAAAANVAYNARESATRLDAESDGVAGKLWKSAAANAAYNAREEATYAIRSHVIPPDPQSAEAWFRQQEKGERKNARMSDRFIGALPRELTPDQCIDAVESFCRRVTQDRVPWHFALHLELEKSADPDWNPHTHIIFRDRDIENGKRVLYTSAGPRERRLLAAKGIHAWSTADLRVAWGEEMNRAMERAGHDARIDHRSLADRGIDRDPQIHEGVGAQRMQEKGIEQPSRDQEHNGRTVPYTVLDQGSRVDHNARIKDGNRLRLRTGHPSNPREVDEKKKLREVQAKTRVTLAAEQERDREALRQAQAHMKVAQQIGAATRIATINAGVQQQSADAFAAKWQTVQSIADEQKRQTAAEALRTEQQKALNRKLQIALRAEFKERAEAARQLRKQQEQERQKVREAHKREVATLARQQAAERLGTVEKWRAFNLDRRAAGITASAIADQGLVAEQRRARQLIDLRRQQGQQAQRHPRDAAVSYFQQARKEYEVGQTIRREMTADREPHQGRERGETTIRQEIAQSMREMSESQRSRIRQDTPSLKRDKEMER